MQSIEALMVNMENQFRGRGGRLASVSASVDEPVQDGTNSSDDLADTDGSY